MNDRELLELAAKAAGIEVVCRDKNGFEGRRDAPKAFYPRIGIGEWNPLTDDGDALRLAVKLHIVPIPIRGRTAVVAESYPSIAPRQPEEEYGEDPVAATRRAIVRAAAEIGKAMEGSNG